METNNFSNKEIKAFLDLPLDEAKTKANCELVEFCVDKISQKFEVTYGILLERVKKQKNRLKETLEEQDATDYNLKLIRMNLEKKIANIPLTEDNVDENIKQTEKVFDWNYMMYHRHTLAIGYAPYIKQVENEKQSYTDYFDVLKKVNDSFSPKKVQTNKQPEMTN